MTENDLDKILREHKAGVVVLLDKDDDILCGLKGGIHGVMALICMTLVEIHRESGESYDKLGKMLNEIMEEAIKREDEE